MVRKIDGQKVGKIDRKTDIQIDRYFGLCYCLFRSIVKKMKSFSVQGWNKLTKIK